MKTFLMSGLSFRFIRLALLLALTLAVSVAASSAAQALTYRNRDFNGDGRNDTMVINTSGSVRVNRGGGGGRNYQIGRNWDRAVIGGFNIAGGVEVCVHDTYISRGRRTSTAWVIDDKIGRVFTYQLPSPTYGLRMQSDLNTWRGAELVYLGNVTGAGSKRRQNVNVIDHQARRVKLYGVPTGWTSTQAFNRDGIKGNEVVFFYRKVGNARRQLKEAYVVHRTGQVKYTYWR